MTTRPNILAAAAEDVLALTDAARMAVNDPLDQIRLLAQLAAYGRDGGAVSGPDPVGVAGFRSAGPGNVWAISQRATAGTYTDAGGVVRNLAPRTVRPVFTNGVLSGYLDEPHRTNLQVTSGLMVLGAGAYSIGANSVNGQLSKAPDGTISARRVIGDHPAGTHSWLGRSSVLAVSASTTYTISFYVKQVSFQGGNGRVITVDFSDGTSTTRVQGTPIASLGLQQERWTRVSKTVTAPAGATTMQVYYLDAPFTGDCYDTWGCQIEQASAASSFIYTPKGAGATRDADDVVLSVPELLSGEADGARLAAIESAALCRRSALLSLARAVAAYEPASTEEAQNVLRQVVPLFDAEILDAADRRDDATYGQLRRVRSAVVQDLTERAIDLPSVITVESSESLPALVHAQQQYGDGARGDELSRRVPCPHPLFFPRSFRALSE